MMPTQEATDKFGVKRGWLWHKSKKHDLGRTKIGRVTYYDEDLICDLLEKIEKKKNPRPDVRNWDCIGYSDCLWNAAQLKNEKMDCGWCTKYRKS